VLPAFSLNGFCFRASDHKISPYRLTDRAIASLILTIDR
jgi:hypothetical protein